MSTKFGTQQMNTGNIETQDTTNIQNADQGKHAAQAIKANK